MTACMLTPHEEWVLARAEYFTAAAFKGRGTRQRTEHPTRDAAKGAAKLMASAPGYRGAMVYAVYRSHEALTDTFQKGHNMDMEHHLISWVADGFRIQSFTTPNDQRKAFERVPEGTRKLLVSEPGDLKGVAAMELVALRNHLSAAKPIKLFQTKEKGVAAVWSLLTTRKDPEEGSPSDVSSGTTAASTTATTEEAPSTTPASGAPVGADTPAGGAPATPAGAAAPAAGGKPEEDTNMAAKKKGGTKKAKAAPKANGERAQRKLKTDGIVYAVKTLVLRKPSISLDDLITKLKADGFTKLSESTVATFRQDFVHSLRFLKAKGYDIPGVEA